VKFLIDMPLPPALAHWLVSQGHDAVHAPLSWDWIDLLMPKS
jgi:predicted nuclease of predicted toxin-antitoxin system